MNEDEYYEVITDYIDSRGCFLSIMEASLDRYFAASLYQMYKAGFEKGISPKVVGALAIESAARHKENRDLGINFLSSIEKQFRSQSSS